MAPVAATMAISRTQSVSDAARARELYKYYQPNVNIAVEPDIEPPAHASLLPDEAASYDNLNVRSNISSSKKSSPDTALTAFCQLVAWRLGLQRAMISVIDAETQYFIAESTKTLDLVDNTRHAPGDDMWIGCTSVDKAGRLCEKTIEVPPDPAGEYSAFVVNDLSKDERFNQLPFVTSEPFLKLYAGVPLVTKNGIAIGSLFVVDDRVRNGVSKDEIRFMGTMAATIMRHMEMTREVEEHRRGMKMSRGLASFVEGRSELIEDEIDTGDQERDKIVGQLEIDTTSIKSKADSPQGSRAGSVAESIKNLERKEKEYSESLLEVEKEILRSSSHEERSLTEEQSGTSEYRPASHGGIGLSVSSAPNHDGAGLPADSPGSLDISETSTMKQLFSRAANLIREAFEVDGGSVFYDAQKAFSSEFSEDIIETSSLSEEDLLLEQKLDSRNFAAQHSLTEDSPSSSLAHSGSFQRLSIASGKMTEILGFSTPGASSIHDDQYPGSHSFTPMDEDSLHRLMRRYPRGKLWTFDDQTCVSSSEEESKSQSQKRLSPRATSMNRLKKQTRSAAEATLLLRQFPGVRQLLFIPLWDASRSRWLSGNFTWSNEQTRILTKRQELAFLTAFGNSVMAEYHRLDTMIADQKKGDFIGSISHELRSPLHGILASAEFLSEEISAGFSKGLVETIDSCGRTLLDTINHILDFSKINHFEKNWRRSKRGGSIIAKSTPRDHLRKDDLPMMSLFATIDVSIVCEEVVEGVFAGHVFQNVTAPSFDLVANPRGKMSDPRKYLSSSDSGVVTPTHHPEVAVIIDIDYESYQFTTQPGAFRRVIMNLLGNALKYTSKGYVRVKLDISKLEDLHAGTKEAIQRSSINLTVVDTGKGISAEFLRSKLFTAFAQENSLSSGTGLGLSIVRSIVALLEGNIQVKSNLGQGTEVKVTLPLLREMPKSTESSGSTPKSLSSVPWESEELIENLRSRTFGKTVSLYGFDIKTADALFFQANQLLKTSVINFVTNWYGLTVINLGGNPDIIIANEADAATVTKLTRPPGIGKREAHVLVLCSQSSRFNRAHAIKESSTVGILAKPIGPLKLARALGQCLDGVPTPGLEKQSGVYGNPSENNELSDKFEDLPMSPSGGGEVLDNSRMAASSDNARKAIESPTPSNLVEKKSEFPFPSGDDTTIETAIKGLASAKSTSELDSEATLKYPVTKILKARPTASISLSSVPPMFQSPRFLLVDDNKINLNLLSTFVRKKRQNSRVTEAENGQEAVDAVQNSSDGFDVIFMDISMPVLDGFGATRQIRHIERDRREKAHAEGKLLPTPALVMALTGLASSRDQSEAFTSGVDLFLTKPVSFKEVGKMLDNWEANREREHGAKDREEEKTTVFPIPDASRDQGSASVPED